MKLSIKILMLLLSAVIFYSCAPETNIYDGTKFTKAKIDNNYLTDSFKIVKVIDNRKNKDSIIGEADKRFDEPLIINRPLPDYLKFAFNTLICKDTNKIPFIPVTLYVDEFFSSRTYNMNNCANTKFSYLFEYPYNNKIIKLRLIDSQRVCDDYLNIKEQNKAIKNTIRVATALFLINHQQKQIKDSTKVDSLPSQDNKIDTFNTYGLVNRIKYGIMVNNYSGLKTQYGISFSFGYQIYNPKVKYEYGFCTSSNYSQVINSDINGSFIGLSFSLINRIYLSELKNGFFINFTPSIVLGIEEITLKYKRFLYGLGIDESVGYGISKHLDLSLGAYQIFLLNSELLGSDLGLKLSLYYYY